MGENPGTGECLATHGVACIDGWAAGELDGRQQTELQFRETAEEQGNSSSNPTRYATTQYLDWPPQALFGSGEALFSPDRPWFTFTGQIDPSTHFLNAPTASR